MTAPFKRILLLSLPLAVLGLSILTSFSPEEKTSYISEALFKNPARDYHPETWYHFIGGNVSKSGITGDLEAIAAAGISGIQLFHGSGNAWPGVFPQIQTLSKDWDEMVLWAAQECKRLNLRFTMQNCPGWSYAGGPWITPENSMRHLVRSRADLTGGKKISIALNKPQPSAEPWRNYRDLFVIAFPTPLDDNLQYLKPVDATSNIPSLPVKDLVLQEESFRLKAGKSPVEITVRFAAPITLRSVELPPINSYSHAWCFNPGVSITVVALKNSREEKVAQLEMPAANWQDDQPVTIACREVSSDTYRVKISNQHDMNLQFIRFSTAARQQNWESEAGYTLRSLVREKAPGQSPDSWVDAAQVLDISKYMDTSGNLSWEAPSGNWTILRIGHINTGQKNGPAPAEATGWEANKLDPSGARANFNGYIGRLLHKNGNLQNGLLKGVLIDSWECKTQTWTNGLDGIFRNKWNYDLLQHFPALFGYVVENPENTSRFLRDWRVTLNDLLVKNFFGEMQTLSQKNKLTISFETASGDVFPGDILEYYKYADYPMCEFWQPKMDSFVGSIDFKPVKPTVSAAHIYGKKRVAAEAFTSFNLTWNEHPGFLKAFADDHFAKGVTHLVFHTYTHNPRTDFLPPATSFGGGIGTPFNRLQTWWTQMPEFTNYLARCNYLLETGNPVSDVLLYLGDEQNHKPPQSLSFPEGYNYDYCNPDVLLNRLVFRNGGLSTPEGISYPVLWLYDCRRMLPETLEKIISFTRQGLIVVGAPPQGCATLSGGTKAEQRFQNAVKQLWGDNSQKVRSVGKGKVYQTSIREALALENITPDVSAPSQKLGWLHRRSGTSDFYFINTYAGYQTIEKISFRSKGIAELWDPLTGNIQPAKARVQGEQTEIELNLAPGASRFVVFKKLKSKSSAAFEEVGAALKINGPWHISFPANWGINSSFTTTQLSAWKDLPLTREARSFSGTATYHTVFNIETGTKDMHYFLNLGKVEMLAKVKVNGIEAGTRWTYPYEFDITPMVRKAENTLQIEVTGTWFNRLVYDASLPEKDRKTWTIAGPSANSPLKEYGILGPVTLRSKRKIVAQH